MQRPNQHILSRNAVMFLIKSMTWLGVSKRTQFSVVVVVVVAAGGGGGGACTQLYSCIVQSSRIVQEENTGIRLLNSARGRTIEQWGGGRLTGEQKAFVYMQNMNYFSKLSSTQKFIERNQKAFQRLWNDENNEKMHSNEIKYGRHWTF